MTKTVYCSVELSRKLYGKGYEGEFGYLLSTADRISLDNAARWLRDEHNILIVVIPESEYIDQRWDSKDRRTRVYYRVELYDTSNGEADNITFRQPIDEQRQPIDERRFKSWESAMEYSINYAVSVIIS